MRHKEGVNFVFASGFWKAFGVLPERVQKIAHIKIIQFQQYPEHAGLHVHKLSGVHGDKWSFWVNYEYRIIFLIEENVIIFYDIGTHGIYT